MSNIDKRIVEMQFDNKQFEKGVKDTVSSLSDLKKGLDLSGSSKNLADLQAQGDKFSLANIATSVQSLSDRFSTFGIIGMTVLHNLTSAAMDFGGKLIGSVMNPLMEGGKQRALNIEQAKFQFKGLRMDVEATMADASYAVDGTAYSLDAAAKVASQLGASGMRAGDDMRNALRGISGVAAMAGSSYEDIGNVFAKVAGQGRLMGDDLLRLSSRSINAAAIIAKEIGKTEVEVRDMVTKGKVDFKMFADAMDSAFGEHATAANKTFTGAMANVRSALGRIGEKFYTPLHQNLIGPLNDLRLVINEVSKALDPAFESLSAFMEVASGKVSKTLVSFDTGWSQVLKEGINDSKIFKDVIMDVAREHGVALDSIITENVDFNQSLSEGWITADILGDSIATLSYVMGRFSDAELEALGYTRKQIEELETLERGVEDGSISIEELANKLSQVSRSKSIIEELSNSARVLIEAVSNTLKFLVEILQQIGFAWKKVFPESLGSGLVSFIEKIRDLTRNLNLTYPQLWKIQDTFKGLFAILSIGKTIIMAIVEAIGKVLKIFLPAGDGILDFTSSVGNMLVKLDEAIKTTGIFKAIFEGLATVISLAAKGIGKAIEFVGAAFRNLTGNVDFSWLTMFAKIFEGIGWLFQKVGEIIKGTLRGMGVVKWTDIFNVAILTTIGIALKKFIDKLTAFVSGGSGFLNKIKDLLSGVQNSLKAWQENLKANILLKIAGAIAILAASLFLLATIDPVRLASALGAITGLFLELFGSMKLFSMMMHGDGFRSMSKITTAMLGLSTSVLILSFAMKNLATLSWEEIAKGLAAMGGIMLELVAFSYILDKSGAKLVKGSVGLILFATSMVILAQALKLFGSMQWDEIGRGLVGLGGALAAITVAMNFMPKGMVGQGVALIAIATAMLIMSNALKSFGEMQWDVIGRGLTSFAGALTAVTVAMNFMPKGMLGQSVALIAIATAMLIMSNALKSFGSMQWDEIGRGMTVFAGALTAITVALHFLTGAIPGAAALLIVAAALLILTPVLKAFGNMSWAEIGKSMVMLAGIFVIFGVAALLLTPVVPIMFALAGALLLLGVAVLATGAGTLALSIGLTTLATAFTASGAAIFTVLEGLLGLIPMILGKIGEGIVAFAKAIGDGAGAICEAVAKILIGIFQAIIDSAPKFFEAATVLLLGLIQLIIDTVPKFIEVTVAVILAMLKALVKLIPAFIDAGMKIITGILRGIADNIPSMARAGADVVIAFLRAIGTETPRIIDAGFKMIIDFINGIADAIRENTDELITAGQNLAHALLMAMLDVLTGGIFGFSKKAKEAGDAYEGGWTGKIKDIKAKAGEAASAALEGLKSKVKEIKDAGVRAVTGFIEGMGSKISGVIAKAKELGAATLNATKTALDINSPSKKFIEIGDAIAEGMSKGIKNSTSKAVASSEKSSKKVVDAAKKNLEEFQKWLDNQKFYSLLTMDEELAAWEAQQSKYKKGSEQRQKVDQQIYTLRNSIRKRDLEEAQYYNQATLEDELAYWQETQSMYKEGADERLKADREIYRLHNEIKKKELDDDVAYMEERKYYGEMSLNDELWQWLQIQTRYDEGTEERKRADREVYRLRNELGDNSFENSMNWIAEEKAARRMSLEEEIAAYQRIQARLAETSDEYKQLADEITRVQNAQDSFNDSMSWIEQRKYYGELTLAEELAAYTRVQQRYEKGTEERIKMDKEVYRLQKEINEARTKYYDDVAKIEEDRKNKRIQLEQEYADKTKEINQKLQDDIQRLDDNYKNALDSRTKAIYNSYGLFDKVEAKKAVSGSTLMKNLQDQVDELDKWQNQLSQLSAKGLNSALIDELQEMGPSAMAELEALNSMSSSELAQYATLWSTKHNQAKTQATSELEDLRIETQSQIADLRVESAKELDDYRKMWNQQMSDLNTETNKQLKQLKKDFDKQIGIVKANTESDFREMTSNVKEVMQQAGWNEMGQQIVDGLSGGIDSRKQSFIDTIIGVIQGGIAAVQNVADMHSPSRVFAKMGRYMDEGLVVGLKQYSNRVVDVSADVGREAIDSMSNAISGIGSIVNGDIDIAPTIRPVMDMSDFRSGLNYMDTALTADRSMLLGVTAAANQNRTNSYIDELASKLSDANIQSNNKITSAIEGLKSEFAGLVDKVTKLQVVMDTGTLVGAIGPDIDRELGGLSNMTRRGVR